MFNSRKAVIIISLISVAVISIASKCMTVGKYKNLKVLPKDITEQQLDSVMNSYNVALKVSCDFCHAKAKKQVFGIPSGQEELDFALDIPMKEEARKMIRLQIDINKNYFYHDSTRRPEFLNVVTCNTCHRGNPFPAYE
jgi:hypothetical protein